MMRYKTATQWGVFDVEVLDGKITSVKGITADPAPAPMGQNILDGIQHDKRIRRPAVRSGWLHGPNRDRAKRGADKFLEVPWDEALDIASKEIDRVIKEHGNTSVFAGSYGWASAGRFHHAQSQLHRFINLLGGSTRAMNSYSTAAAQVILPHVVAPWHQIEAEQTSWQDIADNTGLVVAFGGIPLRNTQVAYGGITEHQSADGLTNAVSAGVQFVNISPIKSDIPDCLSSQWLACSPGTDVALMLALAYVLETENLTSRDFLDRHCTGYDRFRHYLLGLDDGLEKTPQWAEKICGVSVSDITSLARRLVKQRTFLTAAWSLQRAHHGEQPYWMLVTLAAMLGQVGLPGGGFGFGYGAEGFVGSDSRRFNWATFSKGMNPTRFAIPVARITDMLLNPNKTISYDGRDITFPEVDLIYWAGGNPFHHHQDLNRLIKGWRRPSTVIVNEPWWTPTAQWADIVFPATTALEREDICASSHDPYAHVMQAALPPQHEARSDHEIFTGLANRMGIGEKFTEGRSEREWLQDMWRRSSDLAAREQFKLPSFEQFWSEGIFRLPESGPRPVWLADFRSDPMRYPLKTPSGKIELFSQTIANFNYSDCPGHAAWLEPFERLGGAGSQHYPLHLLTPQPERRLHSQLDHSAHSQAGKIQGKEIISMHPEAAAARHLSAGDIVRVFNNRGACLAALQLDSNRLRDVVSLPTGSWFSPLDDFTDANGNPNVLTADIGTSKLAQGPSANTCLVEVVRHQDPSMD
ncbi:MAG: molybdopterin-dependent oxidoreductase [Gammaproteobacteria bacterium]|nr:molybdopterin-dependent oxidoreductase [Gammaproteobacteria bacterium]